MDEGRDERGFLTPERVRGLFDRAVSYWNRELFFEAHEDWETLWIEAEGDHREWLQGLIQFAAALHHAARGRTASGFVKLMRSAAEKSASYGGDTHGIDFVDLWRQLEPWRAHAEKVAAGTPLGDGAPATFPVVRYKSGVEPAPLPDEPFEDAEESE
jgi:hypothetical protein